MKQITVGDKPLMGITGEHLKQIAIIEGCVPTLEYWNEPVVIEFDATMFSESVTLEYYSTRKDNSDRSSTFTFFLNTVGLSYHYSRDLQREQAMRKDSSTRRLGIKSLSFLIEQGYNIPL